MGITWILPLLLATCIAQTFCWVTTIPGSTRVVYPVRTNHRGRVISNDVSSNIDILEYDFRHKRNSPKFAKAARSGKVPKEKLYVIINNDREEMFLKLRANTKLVTPFTVIEWVDEDGQTRLQQANQEQCFYTGTLKANLNSLVAVSNCDGLRGYIQTNNESYFIEPLKNQTTGHNGAQPRAHVIYKVKSIVDQLNLSINDDQEFESSVDVQDKEEIIIKNKNPRSVKNTEIKRRVGVKGTERIGLRSKRWTNSRYKSGRISEPENVKNDLENKNNEDTRDRKRKSGRKRKKKGKGCKKWRKNKEKEALAGHLGDNSDNEINPICEERERKRKEKKAKKEKRRREKENRRIEKERKRKEIKEQRRRQKEEQALKMEDAPASETSQLPNLVDPMEGEDWGGYSPDSYWEFDSAQAAQAAANTATPAEVSLGKPVEEPDPQKWMELVVAVDYTVIDFHGQDDVEKYIFTLFNIVSAIYEDPSLEAKLQVVMLRIIFYKDKKQSQVRKGLAKKSLESVNRWAERLHKVSPLNLRHDLAVWLTRVDLGGPSGYAPVAGVCEPARSCTLNRDEGLTSAFIIAHEMGHVLGLSHDGDTMAANDCELEGIRGSVMAPLVAATFSRFHWSSCSKKEYHDKASRWKCLQDPPAWNATKVSSKIQYQYSLDDQCRMEFGEGFALCGAFSTDPCTHLWCSNKTTPTLCKTKKGPPLEGTTCGNGKWCRNGFCESMHRGTDDSPVRHNPQHGDWGPWSSWGPCSRTCGTGVSFRIRKCDDPPPLWGGRQCSGKREEWRICGTAECPEPHRDFKAQQCKNLRNRVKLDRRRAKLNWLSYEPKNKKKKCLLSCYSHATNEIFIGKEFVTDGTPCTYDNQNDICVQGKCVPLGCDKVMGSKAREDNCGVCGGDGVTCDTHTYHYERVPPREYSIVELIPRGARQITVRELTTSRNFLALKDNSSGIVLNGGRRQEPSKSFIAEGTKFKYTGSQTGQNEILAAKGPLLDPITIMVWGASTGESMRIETSYLLKMKEVYYQWEVGPFTACSVTCGGGFQHETLICRDRRTDLEVFHDRCLHIPRPAVQSQTCNTFGCEVRWLMGEWEHCSATCGQDGLQERVVSCVTMPEAESGNWTSGIVEPGRCGDHPMPDTTQPCNREPCMGYWEPIGWSECSSSCGNGRQERLWDCQGSGQENEVVYDCGAKPRELRECKGTQCPEPPCQRDSSEFCQLPILHTYCHIPKYRLMCCHTCANVLL
ncbi:unnamed protein product, partial [Meganyctiphanes norvegica]